MQAAVSPRHRLAMRPATLPQLGEFGAVLVDEELVHLTRANKSAPVTPF